MKKTVLFAMSLALGCGSVSGSGSAPTPVPEVTPPVAASVCAQPAATRPVGTECDDGTIGQAWFVGTPTWFLGEGYMSEHMVAADAAGPFSSSQLADVGLPDGVTFVSGHLYHARYLRVHRPHIADAAEYYHQVLTILEDRVGGPPMDVYPGVGAGGLTLSDNLPEGDWGIFEVAGGRMTFTLSDVAGIKVGDTVVANTATLEEVAAAFPGCAQVHVRGGTRFDCEGAMLIGEIGGAINIIITPTEPANP